jgi:hypothetical protein
MTKTAEEIAAARRAGLEGVTPGLTRIEQAKRDKLLDILRRLIANPGNAPIVAEVLARDWNPTVVIDGEGAITFDLGKYK